MLYEGSNKGESNNGGSSSIRGEKVWRDRVEPVLVSLSDSYLLLNSISVGASEFLSIPPDTVY